MPFNYNLTGIRGYRQLSEDPDFDAQLEGVCGFLSWAQLGTISRRNLHEVIVRHRLREILEDYRGIVSPEVLKKFVGIQISVTTVTRSRWLPKIVAGVDDEARRILANLIVRRLDGD